MKLAVITAHAGAESLPKAVASWGRNETVWYLYSNDITTALQMDTNLDSTIFIENGERGMLPAYQRGVASAAKFDILAFLHDDTIINDKDWVFKVLKEFEDPSVGLVGFGGALGHGSPALYREPYDYHQLARQDFLSNMEDAENHGRRFEGSCDVAVLDGFALIVRREVLEGRGIERPFKQGDTITLTGHPPFPNGWPLNTPIGYIAYDYWLCCMTRRLGYRIRLLGIPCKHLGGQTFVKLKIGNEPQHWEKYLDAHKYIATEFSDVLPFYVVKR
jgi:hypothetical protein